MDKLIKDKICIIGAGISGLACANKLYESGFNNITILEACDKLGGRLRKLEKERGFADFDIELGAEEVHGKKTDYYKLVNEMGGNLFYYWKENKFYVNYKNEFGYLTEIFKKESSSDLEYVWNLFEDIKYNLKEFPDVTVREFLKSNNISEDTFFLANAMHGVEAGTDIDSLSTKGFANLFASWKAGSGNYFLTNMSHVDIITKAYNKILDKIIYNLPVMKIDYNSDKIIINEQYDYDVVILAIPPNQITRIKFNPNLPDPFAKAANKLKLDSCAKVIIKFKQSFWPNDSSWILTPGLINVYWSTTQKKDTKLNIITGMTAGENCRYLNNLYKTNKDEFIKEVIEGMADGLKVNKEIMKEALIDYVWFDWTDVEYIGGGYTYAMIDEGDVRAVLRGNVEGKIFFAGEATAENGHYASIHGGLESGVRAAQQVIDMNNN
jgi:polyamine oxidase